MRGFQVTTDIKKALSIDSALVGAAEQVGNVTQLNQYLKPLPIRAFSKDATTRLLRYQFYTITRVLQALPMIYPLCLAL